MRLVSVKNITPDMTLAKPIYHNDSILLNTRIKNLYHYKKRLFSLGIKYIYINDKLSQDIIVTDVVREETRNQSRQMVIDTIKDISLNETIEIDNIKNAIDNLINDIFTAEIIMANLVSIKSYDSYTFDHSLNVAILSILIGRLMDLNYEQLVQLGLGAILHDIGKILLPPEILNKPDKLTEEEFVIIKEHTRLGYDYLKRIEEISPVARVIVLSHHERIDGSGYPKTLKNQEIHYYAKITAIADVFDALTTDRIYRKRWKIHETVDYLMVNIHKFDYDMVNKFVKNIAVFPNGTTVILSNGYQAIVKEQNKGFPARPIIRVVKDEQGKLVNETYELDLLEKLDIVIDDTL